MFVFDYRKKNKRWVILEKISCSCGPPFWFHWSVEYGVLPRPPIAVYLCKIPRRTWKHRHVKQFRRLELRVINPSVNDVRRFRTTRNVYIYKHLYELTLTYVNVYGITFFGIFVYNVCGIRNSCI